MARTTIRTEDITDSSIQSLKNRNLIINGAMQVAQRNTQVTGVTSPAYRTCDRYYLLINNLGTWTVDQSTDSPNGFSNSLKMTCTTADASPAATDYAFVVQRIEGQNLQHLNFGTSDAKSMTLSFWVKSNKTGSASVESVQLDNSSKLFSNSYTINSADTWEYKTISVPADTAGQIDNDNGIGLQVTFWMNGGSDYTSGSLSTTWSAYNAANRNPSNLGVGGAVSDYFAITGVQLEVGDVATPFEHESYGETLAKCQRYYVTSGNVGVNLALGKTFFFYAHHANQAGASNYWPVQMRAAPTVTFSDSAGTTSSVHRAGIGDVGGGVSAIWVTDYAWQGVFKTSGWAVGNNLTASYSADAEL